MRPGPNSRPRSGRPIIWLQRSGNPGPAQGRGWIFPRRPSPGAGRRASATTRGPHADGGPSPVTTAAAGHDDGPPQRGTVAGRAEDDQYQRRGGQRPDSYPAVAFDGGPQAPPGTLGPATRLIRKGRKRIPRTSLKDERTVGSKSGLSRSGAKVDERPTLAQLDGLSTSNGRVRRR